MHLQNEYFGVGFPLCAHLYASEGDNEHRDFSIFSYPKTYMRNHIVREIDKDKANGVNNLFLILLFWLYPAG